MSSYDPSGMNCIYYETVTTYQKVLRYTGFDFQNFIPVANNVKVSIVVQAARPDNTNIVLYESAYQHGNVRVASLPLDQQLVFPLPDIVETWPFPSGGRRLFLKLYVTNNNGTTSCMDWSFDVSSHFSGIQQGASAVSFSCDDVGHSADKVFFTSSYPSSSYKIAKKIPSASSQLPRYFYSALNYPQLLRHNYKRDD